MKEVSLRSRLSDRIAGADGAVFLRSDFADLGNYDRVGRLLRDLVREGLLLKIGYGLCAKARPSLFDGKPSPTTGIGDLAAEARARIGVTTAPARMEEAYNAGRTTQVPSGRVVGAREHVRRKKIVYGIPVHLERAQPSRR
jgi:hypothetical protein